MINMRAPGIYASGIQTKKTEMDPADTRCPAMIGIANKGPVHEPTVVASFQEFTKIFGHDARFYLSRSVEAFFAGGGKSAVILRVAHMPRPGEETGPEHGSAAKYIVHDGLGKATLALTASSIGRWGNDVWIQVDAQPGAEALVTRDIDLGVGRALLSSTRGFQVGDLVRIGGGVTTRDDKEVQDDHILITDIQGKEILWSPETPLSMAHKAAAATRATVVAIDIKATLRDKREVFRGLQMNPSSPKYVCRVLDSQSRLLKAQDLRSTSPIPHNVPQSISQTRIDGGRDGTDAVDVEDFLGVDTGPAYRSGLHALTAVDRVAMIAVPDAMIFCDRTPGPEGHTKVHAIQEAIVTHCELLKDRFAILDIPRTKNVESVKRWRRKTDSSYCAFYWPWLTYRDQNGNLHNLPPSGPMTGAYANTESTEGVHRAPANVAMSRVEDVELRITEDHVADLNNSAVNTFRVSRALGVRPWGAKTASTDPDWKFINVRRLFIMLRRAIESQLDWVPFEANDRNTWDSITARLNGLLGKLFQRGMFAGGNSSDAYYVKCNDETNPPEFQKEGKLVCEIGIAPSHPTEFIVIQVEQEMADG